MIWHDMVHTVKYSTVQQYRSFPSAVLVLIPDTKYSINFEYRVYLTIICDHGYERSDLCAEIIIIIIIEL